MKAPADGTVNILPNYRNSNGNGPAQEFRAGDRAWAGAQILDLPDLSSVHVMSHIDESDRGQLKVGPDRNRARRRRARPCLPGDRRRHLRPGASGFLVGLAPGEELRPHPVDHATPTRGCVRA